MKVEDWILITGAIGSLLSGVAGAIAAGFAWQSARTSKEAMQLSIDLNRLAEISRAREAIQRTIAEADAVISFQERRRQSIAARFSKGSAYGGSAHRQQEAIIDQTAREFADARDQALKQLIGLISIETIDRAAHERAIADGRHQLLESARQSLVSIDRHFGLS